MRLLILLIVLFCNINSNKLNAQIINNSVKKQKTVFELPLQGSTGYAFVVLKIRKSPNTNAGAIRKLKQSEGFKILKEVGEYWKILSKDTIGYVKHKYCYINLPDILPSIVYKNTNSFKSLLRVGKVNIPHITDKKLYDTYKFSQRFDNKTFIMPIKYETAKKLNIAQKEALKDNNTLIIYEAFRPYKIQRKIVHSLRDLLKTNTKINNSINKFPWSIKWFISTRLSNHQRGSAIDLSLGKIIKKELKTSGNYNYLKTTKVNEYKMQTSMHELHINSTIFDNPKTKTYSKRVNIHTKRLHEYMKKAGFTPLSSEWWHFDDKSALSSNSNKGNYFINKLYSVKPL